MECADAVVEKAAVVFVREWPCCVFVVSGDWWMKTVFVEDTARAVLGAWMEAKP